MPQNIRIRDVMSRDSFRLPPGISIEEAAAGLLLHRLPGAPVTDDEGRLLGFISEHDLLPQLLDASYHGSSKATVQDIMRTDVLSMSPDDGIIELAQLMSQPGKPKVYPVVENGQLVGNICRSLLLQALLENRREAACI